MSEETKKNAAAPGGARGRSAPGPPAADAAAAEAPKKDAKRDIFAEIGGGEEEIKIHKAKGAKNVSAAWCMSPPPSTTRWSA